MQLSRFVVSYKDVRPGEHVLYSVLEDRYVGVDDLTLRALPRWERGDEPASDDEREVQEALLDDGFLVRGRADDDAHVRAYLDKAADGMPGTLLVTLMPTLQCNLACNYCFQKDHPAFTKMSRPTEDATLEWVLRLVDERRLKAIKVHYFGGEPTTRKDFCLRSAEVLSAAMKARGGKFEWTMTTNGVLLDVAFARKMESFGPGTFKITLDGDKETHDKERIYRDGRGSFDVIFENVVALAKAGCKVRIGGNFYPDQAASFERLLDRIEQSGVARLLDGVRFKPVVDTQHQESGSCTNCSYKGETQTLVQLNRSVEKRKMAAPVLQGELLESMLGPCELHWKNSYTIDPEGNVYKCPAVAGMPDLAVAQVASSATEKIAPLVELRPWEQCGDCPYLPVCVGGCLGGQFLKTRRRDQVACKKEMFEKSFRETVVHRYLAEFTEEKEWTEAA
ncbi:MAG: radical SAM protein [Deltaproteobacteria bacterium]|nr:MAG: radical SAM protein [Deltaproteobacteria bacterium]